jgi:hypothetical protein
MTRPLSTGKQSVDLASAVPGSRIRRDPPPAVKELVVRDREGRDQQIVVIGVVAFALALFIIIVGFISVYGWSPSQYTIHIEG